MNTLARYDDPPGDPFEPLYQMLGAVSVFVVILLLVLAGIWAWQAATKTPPTQPHQAYTEQYPVYTEQVYVEPPQAYPAPAPAPPEPPDDFIVNPFGIK